MLSIQQSGYPRTQTVEADSEGVCVRLPAWSISLTVNTRNPVRIYWTKPDFDADKNGLDISGDDGDESFSAPAQIANLFVRGLSGSTSVTITSLGVG